MKLTNSEKIVLVAYGVTTLIFHFIIAVMTLSCAGTADSILTKSICYYRDGYSFIFSHTGTFLIDTFVFMLLFSLYKKSDKNGKSMLFKILWMYLVGARLLWLYLLPQIPRPYIP